MMRARGAGAPALVLLLLIVALAPLGARADVTTGDAQLDPLFTAFVEGRGDARVEALDARAASGRADVRALLQGILDRDFALNEGTGEIVRATKRGRTYDLTALPDGADRGNAKRRDVELLKLDNALRAHLRDLIAALGLESDDRTERLAAVRALLSSPEAIERPRLEALLEAEPDPEVRTALGGVLARQLVASADPAERRAGIETLGEDLSNDSRRAIA